MKKKEIEKLKKMTAMEIMRKYWPMVMAGKITPDQYSWLIRQGK